MNRKSHRWVYVALSVMLALSTARDARLLFSFPVAVGDDGYYYVLQINSLLKTGHLYFSSRTPLVFYAFTGLSIVTRNIVLAIKLGSLGLNVCLCLGVFALVSSLTRNRWLGVLGSAIAALSGMHFYLIAEFIKNLAGVTLFIWSAWCAIRSSEHHKARWLAASAALIIFSLLSHVSIWGIAPALFAMVLLTHYVTNKKPAPPLKLVLVSAVCFLAICPALLTFQRFVPLPPWLGTELLVRPRWPISLKSPVGKAEVSMLLVIAPAALFMIVRHRSTQFGKPFFSVVAAVSLWSLLITLNPFLNHDVTQLGPVGRLDHLMYLQVAILAPALIWQTFSVNRTIGRLLLGLTFCFMAASMASPFPKGLQSWYLAERQQMIQALPEQGQKLTNDPSVIARHGDEFIVTWVLGIPAQQNFPVRPGGQSIYWLLHQVNPTTLMASTIVVMEEDNGSGLVLLRHDDMDQWMSKIGEEERNRLLTQNPHLKKYVNDLTKHQDSGVTQKSE